MGGADNLDQALAIFTRLRTGAAGGKVNTPCNDKEIELALATLFSEMEIWPQFDALRLHARLFPGFETDLCLSIRYFSELLASQHLSPTQSRLLGQAIHSAALAVEASGFISASCLSQLAHSVRLLPCWPDILLQQQGIQKKDVKGWNNAAKFLFATASEIAPYRQQLQTSTHWRTRERELRARLSQRRTSGGSAPHEAWRFN